MIKRCSKCGIEKDEEQFPMNGKRRHSWCKECHREIVNKKYKENRDYANSLKSQCSICGYDRNTAALEWHHPDDNKEYNINTLTRRALSNKDKLLKELEKCVLVCANCHREIHNPHLNKKKV